MTLQKLTRRSLTAGAAAASFMIIVKPLRAADYKFMQFHNQSVGSSIDTRLKDMWNAVRIETNGRVETEVFAENNHVKGSDPAALKMLIAGDLAFFTLMGGILGQAVQSAEVQQVPFSFRSASEAHKAMDGALGAYLRDEMAAKGIYGLPVFSFDNGMRQISMVKKAIFKPEDLSGQKIRVPAGQMFTDTFKAFGAEPVTINVDGIYEGLKTGKADGQENPLAVIDNFKLYEVSPYISTSNHMWSGFNLMANLKIWKSLPQDIKDVIERNATKYVRLQRADQQKLNEDLRQGLETHGVAFNAVDGAPFRARLAGVYAEWKGRLGTKCWGLLEETTGRLG